nr:hypothetical protein Iba_chr13cCG3580 [Ipomoea batatas]
MGSNECGTPTSVSSGTAALEAVQMQQAEQGEIQANTRHKIRRNSHRKNQATNDRKNRDLKISRLQGYGTSPQSKTINKIHNRNINRRKTQKIAENRNRNDTRRGSKNLLLAQECSAKGHEWRSSETPPPTVVDGEYVFYAGKECLQLRLTSRRTPGGTPDNGQREDGERRNKDVWRHLRGQGKR